MTNPTTQEQFAAFMHEVAAWRAQPPAPAPAPAPAPSPTVPDGFGAPAATGGGDEFGAPAARSTEPRIKDLYDMTTRTGRLLLIRPYAFQRNVPSAIKNQDGTPKLQDRITADIVVLDGGPLHCGGRPEQGVPHTVTYPTPYLAKGRYLSQVAIVSALRAAYAAHLSGSGPKLVLARLSVGSQTDIGRNPPYLLDGNVTDADKALARTWLSANKFEEDPFAS